MFALLLIYVYASLHYATVHFDQEALRRGFLVSSDPGLRLFVDTGGDSVASTTAVASAIRGRFGIARKIPVAPKYIDRYYGGIGVQGALGARWIAQNPFTVEVGDAAPSGQVENSVAVPLQLIDHSSLDAYVSCAVAGQRLSMLFDTGALGWPAGSKTHRGLPQAVNFVRSLQYEAWRAQHPQWPVRASAFAVVRENGKLVDEPAILVPDIQVGAYDVGPQWFVRRSDESTYRWLQAHDGVNAVGDLGLAAFTPAKVLVDYPHARLVVRSKRKERETSILVRAPHLINRQAGVHLVPERPEVLKR